MTKDKHKLGVLSPLRDFFANLWSSKETDTMKETKPNTQAESASSRTVIKPLQIPISKQSKATDQKMEKNKAELKKILQDSLVVIYTYGLTNHDYDSLAAIRTLINNNLVIKSQVGNLNRQVGESLYSSELSEITQRQLISLQIILANQIKAITTEETSISNYNDIIKKAKASYESISSNAPEIASQTTSTASASVGTSKEQKHHKHQQTANEPKHFNQHISKKDRRAKAQNTVKGQGTGAPEVAPLTPMFEISESTTASASVLPVSKRLEDLPIVAEKVENASLRMSSLKDKVISLPRTYDIFKKYLDNSRISLKDAFIKLKESLSSDTKKSLTGLNTPNTQDSKQSTTFTVNLQQRPTSANEKSASVVVHDTAKQLKIMLNSSYEIAKHSKAFEEAKKRDMLKALKKSEKSTKRSSDELCKEELDSLQKLTKTKQPIISPDNKKAAPSLTAKPSESANENFNAFNKLVNNFFDKLGSDQDNLEDFKTIVKKYRELLKEDTDQKELTEQTNDSISKLKAFVGEKNMKLMEKRTGFNKKIIHWAKQLLKLFNADKPLSKTKKMYDLAKIASNKESKKPKSI
jgi:hypothetical protein